MSPCRGWSTARVAPATSPITSPCPLQRGNWLPATSTNISSLRDGVGREWKSFSTTIPSLRDGVEVVMIRFLPIFFPYGTLMRQFVYSIRKIGNEGESQKKYYLRSDNREVMKRKVIRILLIIIALITIAAVIAYFIFEKEKPWLAFYMACCAGVLVVNLIFSIFFISKNFKDKMRK